MRKGLSVNEPAPIEIVGGGGMNYFLLASFNSGPSDVQGTIAAVVGSIAAIAIGLATRRVVAGMLAGGVTGLLTGWALVAICGGFLGAEILLMVFAAAGTILAGAAGLAGSLIASARRKRRGSSATGRHDASRRD
jgi:hypothetical protein